MKHAFIVMLGCFFLACAESTIESAPMTDDVDPILSLTEIRYAPCDLKGKYLEMREQLEPLGFKVELSSRVRFYDYEVNLEVYREDTFSLPETGRFVETIDVLLHCDDERAVITPSHYEKVWAHERREIYSIDEPLSGYLLEENFIFQYQEWALGHGLWYRDNAFCSVPSAEVDPRDLSDYAVYHSFVMSDAQHAVSLPMWIVEGVWTSDPTGVPILLAGCVLFDRPDDCDFDPVNDVYCLIRSSQPGIFDPHGIFVPVDNVSFVADAFLDARGIDLLDLGTVRFDSDQEATARLYERVRQSSGQRYKVKDVLSWNIDVVVEPMTVWPYDYSPSIRNFEMPFNL